MQPPARYLVIIDGGGAMIARLFDAELRQMAEFDASSEEVVVMTSGLAPQRGADDPRWDRALRGHNAEERAQAQVYLLDV